MNLFWWKLIDTLQTFRHWYTLYQGTASMSDKKIRPGHIYTVGQTSGTQSILSMTEVIHVDIYDMDIKTAIYISRN